MVDVSLGKVKITEIIKIMDNETNEQQFLIHNGDEWEILNEEEYKKLIEV